MTESRRNVLRAVGAAGILGLAGCNGVGSDENQTETGDESDDDGGNAGNWRSVDGDAGNTSANTAVTGPTSEPSSEILYEVDGLAELQAQPVVEDGQIFVLVDGKLLSLSSSGEKQWEYAMGDSLGFSEVQPAVWEGTVYVPTTESLVAVANGERQWAANLESSAESAPVANADGVVISTQFDVVSVAHDGSERWRKSVSGDGSRPAVDGDTVYHFDSSFSETELLARSASDGSVQWRESGRGDKYTPVVADGTVYTREYDNGETTVHAVSGSDGSIQWTSDPITGLVNGYPALGDGTVYLVSDAELHAFDIEDGSSVWDSPYVTTSTTQGQPRIDGNSVYLHQNGSIVAVDSSTGEQRWSADYGDSQYPGYSGFCLADGRVYIGGDELYELA